MRVKNIVVQNILTFSLLLLSMVFTIINDISYPFYLLIIVYMLLANLCRNNCKAFGKLPGRTVINIVLFIRYCFLPLVLCIDGTLSIYANNYDYMNAAIALMIYEMVVIFLALELSALKQGSKKASFNMQSAKGYCPGKFPILLVLIILICIFVSSKGALLNFSLFNKNHIGSEKIDNLASWEVILWEVLLAWLFVSIINYQKKKYDENPKRRHVICSVLVGIVYLVLTFLAQARISRWYFLISCISVVFILYRFYPKRKKTIIAAILIPTSLLLVFVTAIKNGNKSESSILSRIGSIINSTVFDSYFAGPVSVNNAIGLIQNGDVSIKCFIYDVLNNFPVINKLIEPGHSSVYLYNLYLGRIFGSGGDQILPLVGQSAVYFTFALSPFLSVVSVLIASFSDRMFYASNGSKCYLWGFTSAWLGVATILNMTVTLSWIYVRILPMFIMFYLLGVQIKKH